jgi:hypothetical protein
VIDVRRWWIWGLDEGVLVGCVDSLGQNGCMLWSSALLAPLWSAEIVYAVCGGEWNSAGDSHAG